VPGRARELLDVAVGGGLVVGRLEPREACVDTAPAGADELHQQGEIVDSRLPLGEQVRLDALESRVRLIEEPPELGDVPRDRKHLRPETRAHGITDIRYRCLEAGGRRRQRLDLVLRALDRGLELGRCSVVCSGGRHPSTDAFESCLVHARRGYSQRRMDTAALDYELPTELIAQHPVEPRDASRLLVYRRETGSVEHRGFRELPDLLGGVLAVLNDSRVVPARLRLQRATGGAVEVLLVERVGENGVWEALVRPARRLRSGETLGPVRLLERLADGGWLVQLEGEPAGEAPLPPYIKRKLEDPERYQTVYARETGSAAAPTAGLHFTQDLLGRIEHVAVTLHVGLDTFRPVTAARVEDHALRGERYQVEPAAWDRIVGSERVLAVGTTAVRVLETVTRSGELHGRTSLLVTPGFEFRRVDALLTNFHLPRTTLLALVMAFAGVEETRDLYRVAIEERYRFYSFGDAMLVL
jgi:S-adenosylmethionine:tRNA ribosyltransferase-isomerase